jgi:hypothetical protein
VTVEATLTISDGNPGAEDEGGTFFKYNSGVERCHQVHWWIFDEHPNLTRQLSMFYWEAYLGIP